MRSRLVVVMLALAACSGGAGRDVRGPVANQPTPDERAARPALTLDDALRMMPADTEIVLELDVARLRQSALWERIEPWLRQQGGATLDEVAHMCDFDPLGAFDTLLVGARGLGGQAEMTMFIRGFPQKKASACLERAAAAARERGEDKRVRVDGDRITLFEADQVTLVFEFVDSHTLLAAASESHFSDAKLLDAALARRDKGGLDRTSPFYGVIGRVDTTATVWFAVAGNAAAFASLPYPVRAVRAELHTGSDPARALIGSLVVELDDPNNTSSMAAMFKMAIDTLNSTPYADIGQALVVTEEGASVMVDVRLDMPQLERLGVVFGAVLP
jgi:hypothetical protein